jgi:ankyrin repeat protein
MRARSVLMIAAAAAAAVIVSATEWGAAYAQPPAVDFTGQIKPILQTRCVACHGPNLQRGGLRLDNRHDAMRGGVGGPVIVPGEAQNSRLFTMVASKKMPLDDELSQFELDLLRVWINRGATWPAPREMPNLAVSPLVAEWRAALRAGDRRAIARLLRDPSLPKARGADATTPLQHAALMGTIGEMRRLLEAGADPNAADLEGFTPLMWAVRDEAKARLLIEQGADVNAVSEAGITPLIAAAGQAQGGAVVRRLVQAGARPTPAQQMLLGTAAGGSHDVDTFRALAPALIAADSPAAVQMAGDAARTQCWACLDHMIAAGARGPALSLALVFAANNGDAQLVKRLLGLGATLDGRGPQGATALIAAATSDTDAAEKVRLLLEAGADPNVPAPDGRTAIAYARARHPELTPLLLEKGAR